MYPACQTAGKARNNHASRQLGVSRLRDVTVGFLPNSAKAASDSHRHDDVAIFVLLHAFRAKLPGGLGVLELDSHVLAIGGP